MRRSALILILAGCGQNDIPTTGGFQERIVDNSIRHGQQLEVADIDEDGSPDIVAAFSLTDAVHVYLNTPEQKFEGISVSGATERSARQPVATTKTRRRRRTRSPRAARIATVATTLRAKSE